MRSFVAVFRFEFWQQARSPFFWGVVPLFFLIHLLTVTSIGIHLGQNHRIDINGAGKVLQVVTAYTYLAMLPVVVFVIRAIVSDFDRGTASIFFVTPVTKLQFLCGRLAAALMLALAVGTAGLLGVLAGPWMPWAEQEPLGDFTWIPYGFSLATLIIPNALIMCALFFCVAALTRSAAATVALAAAILVGDAAVSLYSGIDHARWTALADPFGGLALQVETRYWTVPELNSRLPRGSLLVNRLIWSAIAVAAFALTLWRLRLDLAESRFRLKLPRLRPSATVPAAPVRPLGVDVRLSARGALSQYFSQAKVDAAAVLRSPLLYVLMLGVVVTVVSDFGTHKNVLSNLPYYPRTRLMLDVFHYGLISLVMLTAIYYSGALIHREAESGVSEIIGACPYTDWILPASKTVTLWLVVGALLVTALLTSIFLQAAAGYTDFEIPLYLKSLFVYNGFYFAMLCVLAIFLQALIPNKWLGMLLVFAAFALLAGLPSLGIEHVLVGFRIPFAPYSDMNGFGPSASMVYSLIAYWGFFCVLLLLAAYTFFPRGPYSTLRQRLSVARSRMNGFAMRSLAVAIAGTVVAGGWIFYNTNILNEYRSTADQQRLTAEYERTYAHFADLPAPSYQNIALEVDIFPEARRIESRGTATLRNNKNAAIEEFVLTINPRLGVNRIHVDSAALATADAEHGFYQFTLDSPLAPRDTIQMEWDLTRVNQGFVSGTPDFALVENGTFLESHEIMPVPGLDSEMFLTDDTWRRRFGLPPAKGLPELGDPRYLNVLKFGVDSHSEFRATISTSADQIAVTSGVLRRDWAKDGRRYFEYVLERPAWPIAPVSSARWRVARDRWNDVALEIYHDPKHTKNVNAIMNTIKRTLDYMTANFSDYPLTTFRIVEYPGYRSAAKAFPGIAAYPEQYGFITDVRGTQDLDYACIHELAHHWWGGLAYGAKMKGRQMLNETLAQYSTLMVFKQAFGAEFVGKLAKQLEDNYLSHRSDEARIEFPVMYTNDQAYISYNKGALAFYALQDVIGEDRVNEALRRYLDKFAGRDAPFPTSRDVVDELRRVAGDEHQQLITDLFEKIILYDVEIGTVDIQPAGDSFEISTTVSAQQFEADEFGEETEVPFARSVDLAVYASADPDEDNRVPLYQERYSLTSGTRTIVISVPKMPASVEIDPHYKLLDRTRHNNVIKIQP